ncbi:MobA/MobL family protein, partial [Lactiplantibacillus paraplantarum]
TQIKLVHDYVQTNFVDRGMCADWSIHDKEDGNPHAHIMLTTRAIKQNGTWAPKQKSTYLLDENGAKVPQIDPKTG